jgi:ribosome-associated heat shock protein Hsp15
MMRFDLALAALRLFKSRAQASLAIQDGAALLNGAVVKPSHGIKPGDRITLAGARGARVCEVLALPRASLSRAAARELVREVSSTGAAPPPMIEDASPAGADGDG